MNIQRPEVTITNSSSNGGYDLVLIRRQMTPGENYSLPFESALHRHNDFYPGIFKVLCFGKD